MAFAVLLGSGSKQVLITADSDTPCRFQGVRRGLTRMPGDAALQEQPPKTHSRMHTYMHT